MAAPTLRRQLPKGSLWIFDESVNSRFPSRLRVLGRTLPRLLGRRRRPENPGSILVAHHLLAGDVLMLAPLLAKLRERHPGAEVAMTVRKALAPLFIGRPYGVHAVAYDPGDARTLDALLSGPGFDLALVPGDNRYSWLAAAAGARWIVAFAGDRPAYKSWPVDELRPYRARPASWADMSADLVDGPPPARYRPGDWPPPPAAGFALPDRPYAVLHVEASTPLKHWDDVKWLALAERLATTGLGVVWSAGPQGEAYLRRIDPAQRFPALGHRLDLAQLWHLVAGAALLVCPDTSVLHIGRLAGTPTVGLYGPTSAALFGAGDFFSGVPFRAVTVEDFPCRDQKTLFKRRIEWVRRCQRSVAECAEPRCMQAIDLAQVERAARALLDFAPDAC
jgi:ADP-heptose:LPS heptosyltransferase